MELFMEEKWKLAKKGSGNGRNGGGFLKSSSGLGAEGKEGRRSMVRSFSSRCASLVKEQRARVYIVRRCVTMLICWRDYP